MPQIQSSLSEAQSYATSLSNSGQQLGEVSAAEQDEQTTVAGNSNAHSAMTLAQTATSSVAEAVTSAVTNINGVAADFQALDQEAAAAMSGKR